MAEILNFPLHHRLLVLDELDHCLECNRFIESGESYIELPVHSGSQVIHKAICSDCEDQFIVSLGLPVVITDVTSL